MAKWASKAIILPSVTPEASVAEICYGFVGFLSSSDLFMMVVI